MEIDQPENTERLPLEIVALPAPRVFPTSMGFLSETDTAIYLAHHMRDPKLTTQRLRYWRSVRCGPVFCNPPRTRSIWYRMADLDHWLLVDSTHAMDE